MLRKLASLFFSLIVLLGPLVLALVLLVPSSPDAPASPVAASEGEEAPRAAPESSRAVVPRDEPVDEPASKEVEPADPVEVELPAPRVPERPVVPDAPVPPRGLDAGGELPGLVGGLA